MNNMDSATEKPTIMVVDDPDHRDLNAVAAKMLEAGAPYFGKKIKDPEVEVHQPLPEVQINVGAPKVIQPGVARTSVTEGQLLNLTLTSA